MFNASPSSYTSLKKSIFYIAIVNTHDFLLLHCLYFCYFLFFVFLPLTVKPIDYCLTRIFPLGTTASVSGLLQPPEQITETRLISAHEFEKDNKKTKSLWGDEQWVLSRFAFLSVCSTSSALYMNWCNQNFRLQTNRHKLLLPVPESLAYRFCFHMNDDDDLTSKHSCEMFSQRCGRLR